MDTLTIGNQLMAKEIASEIAKQVAAANHDNFGSPSQWIFLAINIIIIAMLIPMFKKYFSDMENRIERNHSEILNALDKKKDRSICEVEHEKHTTLHELKDEANNQAHERLEKDINGLGIKVSKVKQD
jgi:predicted Holliday junction resolvase-like endonuclease